MAFARSHIYSPVRANSFRKHVPRLCGACHLDRRTSPNRKRRARCEICCLDESGRPTFRDLIFRKRQCIFIVFDLLYLNGKDLRTLPLIERKAMLKRLIRRKRARMFYLDHVESDGRLLFDEVVKMDLEGIVCKRKDSPYKVTEKPSRHWIKVKNLLYSQMEGRE